MIHHLNSSQILSIVASRSRVTILQLERRLNAALDDILMMCGPIQRLTVEQLEELSPPSLDFTSVNELQTWLASHESA